MGPHFQKGATKIGRDRLAPGMVAILNDPESLRLAIGEMHAFVSGGERIQPGRTGLVFRVVTVGERDALCWKMQKVCDDSNATCGNIAGYRHVLDLFHVAHILNRHSNPAVEARHGHIAVSITDFHRIPEVVYPNKLVQCEWDCELPRLVYSKEWDDGAIVVVEEIRKGRREANVITMYKHK